MENRLFIVKVKKRWVSKVDGTTIAFCTYELSNRSVFIVSNRREGYGWNHFGVHASYDCDDLKYEDVRNGARFIQEMVRKNFSDCSIHCYF